MARKANRIPGALIGTATLAMNCSTQRLPTAGLYGLFARIATQRGALVRRGFGLDLIVLPGELKFRMRRPPPCRRAFTLVEALASTAIMAVAGAACVSAIKHDELELAVEIAQSGIKAFPESAGLYRALGTAQYRLGDLTEAKAACEQALSLDKAHPLSYFLMGSTLKKLGQTEAAEQYFRQARQLDARYSARR
jgi:tetratricopeptide (TPR) repeat protein